MKSASTGSFLLVSLLLLSVTNFLAYYDVNQISPQKVIDPLLFASTRSFASIGAHLVSALITSPSLLTPSQRMRLSSLAVITGSVGRVTAIQARADALEETLKLDFVSGIFSPRSYHPTLDESASDIGATYVWQNVTDGHGRRIDGSGVIVGIIDTGVDLSHPDLKFPNGTSKVLSLWDQTVSGKPPKGFTYGVECSWDEINDGKCSERDTFGHGTHVASIAASSGLASGKYHGIAPGASLLVVKSGAPVCNGENWTFEDNAIIDGLEYLVEKARELKMRLVVNLSMGGNIGGHDDSSPLELALDDLNSEGVIVTVAAGNDAHSQGHATGSLGRTKSTSVNWGLLGKASSATVDLWFPRDRDISVTLLTPSGQLVQGPTASDVASTSDGLVSIASSTAAKGKELVISVQTQGTLKLSGWSVVLNLIDDGPSVMWDAWVDSDSCAYPSISFSTGEGYVINVNGTVSVPATSRGAIAVGAYVSKNSWLNRLGKNVSAQDYDVGEIASFSSRGPTRDGRTKPEISAPGLFIAAARSSDVPPSDSDPDQYHRVLAGTSMAAPHVAGVVALMLQYNPQLTSREVRSILIEGANLDDFTGFIESPRGSDEWGWGKVDARTATSLFRVSSFLPLLPSAFAVNLTADGEPRWLLKGGEVLTLRFLSGNTQTLEVNRQTFRANSTRYLVAEDRAAFISNGVFEPRVEVQYLLTLESPLGHAEGEGWYDAGAYANFTVAPLETSRGLSHLLGVTFFFDHWVDEHGDQVRSGSLLMDSPHSLRASWSARVTDWRPILLVGVLLVVLVLVLESRGGRLRKQQANGLVTNQSLSE